MNTKKKWLLILATVGLTQFNPSFAQDDESIGIVLAASGEVLAVQADGSQRPLQRRSPIYEGETINTGARARVQIRFNDNGLIALQPESSFFIEAHHYNGQADGTEEADYSLLRGGLQAITGLIGEVNKENYKVDTPLANIGLRGTHWAATYCDTTCDGNPPGLYGGVAEGGIDVCNSAGCTAVDSDTYFYTPNTTTLTTALLAPPSVVFMNVEPQGGPNANDENDDDSSIEPGNNNGVGNGNGGANGNENNNSDTANNQESPVAEVALNNATAFNNDDNTETGFGNRNAPNENAAANSPVFADPQLSETEDDLASISDDEIEALSPGKSGQNSNNGNGGNSGNGGGGNSGNNGNGGGNSGSSGGGNSGNNGSGGDDTSDDTSNDGGDDSTDDTSSPGNSGSNGNGGGNSGNNGNGGGNSSAGDSTTDGTNCAVGCAVTDVFGETAEFESNLSVSERPFDAYWGRWDGPNSNGNQLKDHFAWSPDTTTELPQTGKVSYQLLGATNPTDQNNKEGEVNSINMLIDFGTQAIEDLSIDVDTFKSSWQLSNTGPVPLGDNSGIVVDLSGTCSGACALKFNSIEAQGQSTIELIGPNAEGALGNYDLNALGTNHTAAGAFILEAD